MAEHRIKILSWNLWHGLDHTSPSVMWPLENSKTRKQRELLAVKALKEQFDAAAPGQLILAGLQEVNPVAVKTAQLAKALNCHSAHCEVNVGVKLGPISYPFYLREGLAYLWRGAIGNAQTERFLMTGSQFIDQGPITLQLSERRGSLWLRGQVGGFSVLFVNTHLHHGSPGHSGINEQRMGELKKILSRVSDSTQADLTIFMGDFNFEIQHPEMRELTAAGFEELRLGNKSLVTWSPANNALTRKNSLLDDAVASSEWDAAEHSFDHIFYKIRDPKTLSVTVHKHETFAAHADQGINLSDHYGLAVELSLS